MVNAVLLNSGGQGLAEALNTLASDVPGQGSATSGQVSYSRYTVESIGLTGSGFIYDSRGYLVGGTITSINFTQSLKTVGYEAESYTNLNLPVQNAIALAAVPGGQAAVLGGNDNFATNTYSAQGYAGNDTFTIVGAGTLLPASADTITNINGGAGANTAVFPSALRSAATVIGGGGNETVVQSGITANLVAIDKMQFIDGATYEDNATPGAQATLIFEGILGRMPDNINAGGFGQLAEQSNTPIAARVLLATAEGQADTAGLGNGDFVARLYQNMLHRAPDTPGAAGWQATLDTGILDRATVAGEFASSIEAQSANAALFASGSVFAADPNAVEVLRAYEVLLNRLPESSALSGNTTALDAGNETVQGLYATIQGSTEFLAHAVSAGGSDTQLQNYTYRNDPPHQLNPYGITSGTTFAYAHGVALSDQVTSLITPLVTSNGITVHS